MGISPEEIGPKLSVADAVWPVGTSPVVSVVCWSYNHEAYIAQAVDSFLAQETTFPVEIIIHDDASTDKTGEIARVYEAKYPQVFRNIIQPENLFQNGRDINQPPYAHARGKYIAICEADDYWTRKDKLQTQVEALQLNSEWSGCFHDAVVCDDEGNQIQSNYFACEQTEYSRKDCLTSLLSRYATASLMFKKSALGILPEWFIKRPTDMLFDLVLTGSGKLGHIPINACAYRKHSQGGWTGLSFTEQVVELISRYDFLLLYEPFTSEYAEPIKEKKVELFKNLYSAQDHWKEVSELAERLNQISPDNAVQVSELTERLNQLARDNAIIRSIAYPCDLAGFFNYITRIFPLFAEKLKARVLRINR